MDWQQYSQGVNQDDPKAYETILNNITNDNMFKDVNWQQYSQGVNQDDPKAYEAILNNITNDEATFDSIYNNASAVIGDVTTEVPEIQVQTAQPASTDNTQTIQNGEALNADAITDDNIGTAMVDATVGGLGQAVGGFRETLTLPLASATQSAVEYITGSTLGKEQLLETTKEVENYQKEYEAEHGVNLGRMAGNIAGYYAAFSKTGLSVIKNAFVGGALGASSADLKNKALGENNSVLAEGGLGALEAGGASLAAKGIIHLIGKYTTVSTITGSTLKALNKDLGLTEEAAVEIDNDFMALSSFGKLGNDEKVLVRIMASGNEGHAFVQGLYDTNIGAKRLIDAMNDGLEIQMKVVSGSSNLKEAGIAIQDYGKNISKVYNKIDELADAPVTGNYTTLFDNLTDELTATINVKPSTVTQKIIDKIANKETLTIKDYINARQSIAPKTAKIEGGKDLRDILDDIVSSELSAINPELANVYKLTNAKYEIASTLNVGGKDIHKVGNSLGKIIARFSKGGEISTKDFRNLLQPILKNSDTKVLKQHMQSIAKVIGPEQMLGLEKGLIKESIKLGDNFDFHSTYKVLDNMNLQTKGARELLQQMKIIDKATNALSGHKAYANVTHYFENSDEASALTADLREKVKYAVAGNIYRNLKSHSLAAIGDENAKFYLRFKEYQKALNRLNNKKYMSNIDYNLKLDNNTYKNGNIVRDSAIDNNPIKDILNTINRVIQEEKIKAERNKVPTVHTTKVEPGMPQGTKAADDIIDAEIVTKELTYKTNNQLPPGRQQGKPPVNNLGGSDDTMYANTQGEVHTDLGGLNTHEYMRKTLQDVGKNAAIINRAEKILDTRASLAKLKHYNRQLKVDDANYNIAVVTKILDNEAKQLIKQIESISGYKLPQAEAEKIIQMKFKEVCK